MADNKEKTTEETVETAEETVIEEKETKAADKKESKKSDRKEKVASKELEEKQKKIDELENTVKENEDKYLRMLAEYDNFRKRAQKEKDSMYSAGIADSVEKLLEVLDNLERAAAVDVEKSDAKSVVDGVVNVLRQATAIFEKMGVTEIPAKGEKFDPNVHNAVMHEDNPDIGENTITDVFLKGYILGDKVIRHSVVKVAN